MQKILQPVMAYNENLATRIREALAHLPGVEEKKMFGGLAFIVDGKMCITVGKDKIMCRINPAIHDEAIMIKGVETVLMRGRQYTGYVHINADSINAKKDLDYWMGLALTFNKIAKATNKK